VRFNSLDQLARLEGYADYHAYLRSDRWLAFRAGVLKKSKHCRVCEGPADVIHHLTYARLGHEARADVVTVCARCHEMLHAVHREHKLPVRRFSAAAKLVRRALKQGAPVPPPEPTPGPPPVPAVSECDPGLFARRELVRKLLSAGYTVVWISRRYGWEKAPLVTLVAWIEANEMGPSERARLQESQAPPARRPGKSSRKTSR
jgi:hypothetical protein